MSIEVTFSDTVFLKSLVTMAVQLLFYARTLKGGRRLDVTERAAEQSKDEPKVKTETK